MASPKRTSTTVVTINALSNGLTMLIQITALVWVHQFLVRRVEPAEYAILAIVTSLMVFNEMFRSLFGGGISRFMVEAFARNEKDEMTRIVSSIAPVLTAAGICIMTVGYFAIQHLDHLVKIEPQYLSDAKIMFALLLGTSVITIIGAPFTCGLYVRQQFIKQNLITLSGEILRVTLLLWLLLGVSPKALWLVVATFSATISTSLARMVFTFFLLPAVRFRPSYFSLATMKKLLGFSVWMTVQSVGALVERTLPLLLLNRVATPIETSAFYLGRLPDTKIRQVIQALGMPIQPALTSIYALEGADALRDFYYRGGKYHLWVGCIFVAPMVIFGADLMRLYTGGSAYEGAYYILLATIGTYPAVWASAMFYKVAYATGRISSFNIWMLMMRLLIAIALFVLIIWQDMGLIGAALAIGMTVALFHLGVLWEVGRRFIDGSWTAFIKNCLIPGGAPLAVALPIAYIFQQWVAIEGWAMLGLGSILCSAAYLATLLFVCLDPLDRRLLSRAADKILLRINKLRQRS